MTAKLTMCESLSTAQTAFDNACVVFASSHNLTELAEQVGIPSNVMRNMLNPEQPRLLTPPVLVAITQATDDFTIWNALSRGLNMVSTPLEDSNGGANSETFLKRVLENSLSAGDLSRMALEHGGARLPRTAQNRIIQQAYKGINNLVLLVSDLENRTQGASPFLSMSLDFVASGAAIPGLT